MVGKRFLGAVALMLAGMSTSIMADTVLLTTPQDYHLMGMSPNGKWACGVYVDFSETGYAFRWNLETGAIELLGSSSASSAWAVADDGTVSGTFMDSEALPNHTPVEMPGYYKDGKWNGVEMPEGVNGDGVGYGISNDGHYISGSVMVNGVYSPMIWKDGKIYRNLYNGKHGMAYCISPDGQTVGGWAYKLEKGSNRCACYWDENGNQTWPSDYESPWSSVQKFSPDGKKLLFWGGWNRDEEEESVLASVYDLATGEVTWIPTIVNNASFQLFDISDSYTIVGEESNRAYINVGGKGQYLEDYLTAKGVDFETTDVLKMDGASYYMLTNAMAISADDKCIGLSYYDVEGAPRSMVVMFDRDVTHVAPVNVAATQLKGIGSVCLTWGVPAGVKDIQGYNIYRDGKKVNAEPVSAMKYYDGGLADGTYSYTVAAIYADGTDVASSPVQVTLAPKPLSAPNTLFVRQRGFNSIYAQWGAPETNLIGKGYFDLATADIQGFGVTKAGQSFELGVRFEKEDIANYSDCKLTAVSFYPMAKDAVNWKVNIYTRDADGALSLLKSQAVTQPLNYNAFNTVKLDEPIAVTATDLIVAVETTAGAANTSVIGMDFGHYNAGYSDLIRTVGEKDMYSLVEASTQNGYPYFTSWLINAVLTPDGSAADVDVVDHYNVYADGTKVGETADLSYVVDDMADGTHTFGVDVVYAGNKTSAVTAAEVSIAKNYKGVDRIVVNPTGEAKVDVSWKAPVDDDVTYVSYASGPAAERSVKGPSSNNYGIMAGALYSSSILKGYAGYRINSFQFYPLADATFTFFLYENDEQVCEVEVDDYVLGQWNTVKLPEPFTINDGANYKLVLDCYDVTPEKAPLAVDCNMAYNFYSNLYSLDGNSWSSIVEASINGSWMLGWTMAATTGRELAVSGYDVYVDGTKKNAAMLTEPKFAHDFGTDNGSKHSVRVDAWYPSATESIKGEPTYFTFAYLTGIGASTVEKLGLKLGENYIRVEGSDIESVAVYGLNGVKAASAAGNTLNITNLAAGVYVVKVKGAAGEMTRKVEICR